MLQETRVLFYLIEKKNKIYFSRDLNKIKLVIDFT